jgi:hypothetical protein
MTRETTIKRTIAIGDIHGASIALKTLVEAIDPRPEDTIVLLVALTKGHPLVDRYRDQQRLRAAIPHSERVTDKPFVLCCSGFSGDRGHPTSERTLCTEVS